MFAPWLKGLKPNENIKFTMATAVEDLANTLELRGIERADLVGFSLGGLVALRAAADLPRQIAHLILVSTPVIPPVAMLKMQRRLISIMPASKFTDVPKDVALRAVDALMEIDISTDLGRVHVPTLAVVADSDQANSAAADTFARDLKAKVRRVAAPSSDLLAGAPAELARLIEDFCADRLSDEAA
jgi:pimeloyl-ACP methyl ester carboxylesterase